MHAVRDTPRRSSPAAVLDELMALRATVLAEGADLLETWRPSLHRREFLPSAANLASYIALRRRDLRGLQEALMPLGLSSLGRCEGRVLASLDAVAASLAQIAGVDLASSGIRHPRPAVFYRGNRLLRRNADAIFGAGQHGRDVRILVTLSAETGRDAGHLRKLVEAGADLVRINCAHDTPDDWTVMAANARAAARAVGRSCRVLIDLEGPRARTGRVRGRDDEVRVRAGDVVRLVAGPPEPSPEVPQVECSLPEALAQLRVGDEVTIDEGKVRLTCESLDPLGATLRVSRVEKTGRIRSDKGLNFPDTPLRLDALTAKDLADLDIVAGLADVIGYSFVQSAGDVAALQDELRRRVPERLPAISTKIETAVAVRNLPEIIVQGAGSQPLAVMIARGDLAVEIGFSRLAEIQEELLWLCEAAHVPVIWATNVLDTFVRKGRHTRAEMTDAAMAERAECVMLNKGPFVLDALGILDDVLGRMEAHQDKKTSRLRALGSW